MRIQGARSKCLERHHMGTLGGVGGGELGSNGMSELADSRAIPTPKRAVDRKWSISPPIVRLSEGARRDSSCDDTFPALSI